MVGAAGGHTSVSATLKAASAKALQAGSGALTWNPGPRPAEAGAARPSRAGAVPVWSPP